MTYRVYQISDRKTPPLLLEIQSGKTVLGPVELGTVMQYLYSGIHAGEPGSVTLEILPDPDLVSPLGYDYAFSAGIRNGTDMKNVELYGVIELDDLGEPAAMEDPFYFTDRLAN